MLQKKPWLVYVALAAILLLGLGLRLISRCGLCYADSYAYVAGALRLNDVGLADYLATLSGIYENRISIVFPLAAAFAIFGYSEAMMIALPLSFSLLTLVAAYLLGRRLFSPQAGLLAALLVATIPLEIFYSTSLLPDSMIPLYAALALLTFVYGQEKGNPVYYALAGFFVFCAFQARATSGLLLLPLLAAAWWSNKRNPWSMAVPGATFAGLMLVLWSLLWVYGGNLLTQLEWLTLDATAETFVGTGEFLGHLKEMIGLNGNFVLLYTLLLPALAYAIYKARDTEGYRLPLLTFLLLYLFFEFGSTTLTSYQPIWKQTRFLTILSVPAALLVAAVTVALFSLSKYWLNLLTFAVVGTHLALAVVLSASNGDQTQWASDHIYPYRTTFEKLSAYDDVEVVGIANVWWAVKGQVYSRLYGLGYEYQDLEGRTPEDIEPGTTIIYDPILFSPYEGFHLDPGDYPALEDLPQQVPSGWRLLFTVRKPTYEAYPVHVYRVE